MLSDKDVAFLCADKELTNDEISDLFDGCPGGVEADVFTYGGRAHLYSRTWPDRCAAGSLPKCASKETAAHDK